MDIDQGAACRYGMVVSRNGSGLTGNFLHPLPGETVAALTRDISTSSPA